MRIKAVNRKRANKEKTKYEIFNLADDRNYIAEQLKNDDNTLCFTLAERLECTICNIQQQKNIMMFDDYEKLLDICTALYKMQQQLNISNKNTDNNYYKEFGTEWEAIANEFESESEAIAV